MHRWSALHFAGAKRSAWVPLLHFAKEAAVDTKLLDELNRKVSALIAATPAKDIEKNLRALLSSVFSRLDLVTREEFDVQQEVLRHAREKLKQMEARVAELEAKTRMKEEG
jgi:BMFP domain-containing protein YqiC